MQQPPLPRLVLESPALRSRQLWCQTEAKCWTGRQGGQTLDSPGVGTAGGMEGERAVETAFLCGGGNLTSTLLQCHQVGRVWLPHATKRNGFHPVRRHHGEKKNCTPAEKRYNT